MSAWTELGPRPEEACWPAGAGVSEGMWDSWSCECGTKLETSQLLLLGWRVHDGSSKPAEVQVPSSVLQLPCSALCWQAQQGASWQRETWSPRVSITKPSVKGGFGGTSLVAQWLRLRPPNAGAWVRSLVRELDPTCMPHLRVHMPQLRSPVPQLRPSATKEINK